MRNIIIVDDSTVFIKLLTSIFENEDEINVVGTAKNGLEGIELFNSTKPDLIIMDLIMPIMTGLEAINELAKNVDIRKHPIIILSSVSSKNEIRELVNVFVKGAIDIIEKPKSFQETEINIMKRQLIHIINNINAKEDVDVSKAIVDHPLNFPKTNIDLITIGGSIGSPSAIATILQNIQNNIVMPPILFIIHIKEGFLRYYINVLETETALPIKQISHRETMKPGVIYFAPDNKNVEILEINSELTCFLHNPTSTQKVVPSIDYTFHSISKLSSNVIAGLLTGMGSDGASGLLEIKKNNNFTFIEEFSDCVSIGMPQKALNLGAVDSVISLSEIGKQIVRIGSRIKKQE